jgi:DNA-directed RNA polymerase II subunit RPB2
MIQNIINEQPEIIVGSNHESKHLNSDNRFEKVFKMKFQQVWLSLPMIIDIDRNTRMVYPNECRLRKITYSSNIHVDVSVTETTRDSLTEDVLDEKICEYPKQFLGKVPIMLKSAYCALFGENEMDLCALGECPYDQGGYFVVNGSEKVIISQERQATNHVYVFKTPNGSKYSLTAELRSKLEKSKLVIASLYVKMRSESKTIEKEFGAITVSLPKLVDPDIPIFIVFRSLGLVGDREILEYIVYDIESNQKNHDMMNALKPSFEQASDFRTQAEAIDYLGNRSTVAAKGLNSSRQNREEFTQNILSNYFLPHMGIDPINSRNKAFFLGYMVHRLLLVALRRRNEDDRDHYGNKRLELAGPLMSKLFRMLFYDLRKNTLIKMQKIINKGSPVEPKKCIDDKKITNGLR